MLSWHSGDKNMIEPFKMEEDPDGTSQQVAVIMRGKIYREAGLKNSKHPEVEGLLYDKLCQIGKHKLRDDVRKMALSIALTVSDKEFKPTVDWLDNFMRRFCLSKKMMGFHSSAMLKQKGSLQSEVRPAATLQTITQEDVFSVLGFTSDCDFSGADQGVDFGKAVASTQSNIAQGTSQNGTSQTNCVENTDNSQVKAGRSVDGSTSTTEIAEINVGAVNTSVAKNVGTPAQKVDDVCNEGGKIEKATEESSNNSQGQDTSSRPDDKMESGDEVVLSEDDEEDTKNSSEKKGSESKIGKIFIKKFEDLCEVGTQSKNEDSGSNADSSSGKKGKKKSASSDDSEDGSEENDEAGGSTDSSESNEEREQPLPVKDEAEDIQYSKAENKYYNKNKDTLKKKLEGSVMKCTSCYQQVNHHMKSLVYSHPVLGLFICKKCRKYYGKGRFRKDREGYDEYCRLCAEGGDLLCCEQDNCFNGFCKRCVKRTMGRAELKRAETTEGWACYVCDPAPLIELRAIHRLIISNLKTSEEEDANLSRQDLKTKILKNKFESLKQMRQLRSQRDAPAKGSKSSKPNTSKAKPDASKDKEEERGEEEEEKSNKTDKKKKDVPKRDCKDAAVVEEDEDGKPCPVLRKVMDEMIEMLSKCLENVKVIDSKWKKSKYSSKGTEKARHHVVKQLDAMRNNFEIMENDVTQCLEEETDKDQNVVTENNVKQSSGGRTQKTKTTEEEEEEEEEEEAGGVGEANSRDASQSPVKEVVASEKDGRAAEDNRDENENAAETPEEADLNLDRGAAGGLANSVDHFEVYGQDTSKACIPSDGEHSLPDLTDVIKEIISDPDEPMDAEEKISMIKSLDRENKVPDLGDEDGLKDDATTKGEDKEGVGTRTSRSRRPRSDSDTSKSGSDSEVKKGAQRSSQQPKRMKLKTRSDDKSSEVIGAVNGTGKGSKKSKEASNDDDDGEDADGDQNTENAASTDSRDGGGELTDGDDGEILKESQVKSENKPESDGEASKETGKTVFKAVVKDDGNNCKREKEESDEEGDDNEDETARDSDDAETTKENKSRNLRNSKEKVAKESEGEGDKEEEGTDTSEKGASKGRTKDGKAGKSRERESSSEEEVASTKKRRRDKSNVVSLSPRKLRSKKKDATSKKSAVADDGEEERPRRGKKRRARRSRKKKDDEDDDVRLGLVRDASEDDDDVDDDNESEGQSDDGSDEEKERPKKRGKKRTSHSENEEEEKKDISGKDNEEVKVKKVKDEVDSEHEDKKAFKQDSEEDEKSDVNVGIIKKEEKVKSEDDGESRERLANGVDSDEEDKVKKSSDSRDKHVPKKGKGHPVKGENKKARAALVRSDSEDEVEGKLKSDSEDDEDKEDAPKPRSKKKYYRRHLTTRRRARRSHRKLKLKMTEEEREELKGKQLEGKCQVLVETLSSEVRKKLDEEDFICTSDYPELENPVLPRQMSDTDGCDADEEDSDKEFSRLMKMKCDKMKPGPKSKSAKLKLKLMNDEGNGDGDRDEDGEVNGEAGGSDDGEGKADKKKKKTKVSKKKKEGLLDINIEEEDDNNEDDEEEDGLKKRKREGGISLNEKMKKQITMSSDEEADEEDEDEKDNSKAELEEEERERKKHEKRKAKKKVKDEEDDSDDQEEIAPRVAKKGYMNLNISTDEDEDDVKPKKGKAKKEDEDYEEKEEESESESAYEDDSDFEESPRKRRTFQISSSDSDSGKKKTKKKVTTEEESEEEEEKPKSKRKRIRKMASSSNEDDEDNQVDKESPSKHKKIRKVIRDEDLMETTKNATQEEEERRKRIAERQKQYNEIFAVDVETDQAGTDKLVLDFDTETKKELVSVHEKLVKSLKPHQFKGIKFMWDATVESIEQLRTKKGGGCILAHNMGLGKTLQVITFCHTLLTNKNSNTTIQRILVCCPVNTIFNWVAEFSNWLKGKMLPFDVIELASAKDLWGRAYRLDDWWREGGICIIGYNMFRNLSNSKNKRYKGKMKEIFQKTLLDPGPDLVVCDEGHTLKNEKTGLSIAINKIRTMRRIILTGTPLQNNLQEYHCMVQFVKPNLLGNRKEFMNRFANPIEQGQCVEAMPRDVRRMKRRAHILHNLLEGCVQRFDYTVLKPYLPPKFEYVISVQLSEIQCKLYHYYLDNLARGGPKRQGSGLFVDFGSLSRVWTHPKVLELALRRAVYDEDEEELDDFICDDSTSSESSDDERSRKKKKSKKDEEESEEEEVTAVEPEEERPDGLTESGKVKADWWKKILIEAAGEDFEDEEYLDSLEHSGKVVLLLDILRECCSIGDKVLLFSQSLLTLDMIEDFLQAVDEGDIDLPTAEDSLPMPFKHWRREQDYLRLDGSTPADARKNMCRIFNDTRNERCRLLLISTRAGGLGINLVGANRVIIFDSSWNPSHDTQSIFRVYRFGQKKPCYIYRFVAQGTMEEKIYSRQVTKISTALRVVDEHQIKRYYKMNELAQLYEFNPSDPDIRETPIVPKDRLLAELLQRQKKWIVSYHEHESLLENQTSEELSEEERKAAWEDYENEKKGLMVQNYRNSVMPVMGAPTILNHPGLPSLSLSSFSLEGVVSTIKAQNPNLSQIELCESVLLATKQIQKVHLSQYHRVETMLFNLKNPMIAPEQRKLLPFGNHPEMVPMFEQQLKSLRENIQREDEVILHIDKGAAQRNQLISAANMMSAGLVRGQPESSGRNSMTVNYVERPSSSTAGRPTVSHSEISKEKKTGSYDANDVVLLD